MPELPEVEEVRRTLQPHLLGVAIASVRVLRRDFVTPAAAPLQRLAGQAVTRIHRHGKKLFLITADAQCLVLHLGMSGRVDFAADDAQLPPHTHVVLQLANQRQVRFRDPRRFGGLWYYPTFQGALEAQTANLGPDALELTPAHLAHWRGTRGRLKQRLLSQRDVAGLGNIYVDEALWMTQLHPLQRVCRVRPDRIAQLTDAIRDVLHRSIALGGTTLRDYRNVSNQPGAFAQRLQAYGRGGKPCRRCGATLASALIATRTTVYCPSCQKCR